MKNQINKKTAAIKLSNFNEVFFDSEGVKTHEEIIESAKIFAYGMDGVGGYNFTDKDVIILGFVDLTKEGTFPIMNSFVPTGSERSSNLLKW